MKNIQLFLGTDRLKVDTTELTAPTISYSIKDIKNFGQKNASFTKPISVYHTANTDRIFKGLFNINSTGGYDIGTKVYGELQENGITILKGTVQVVGITLNTYEIILFSNNLSIFDEVGEELISGNQNSSLDVKFDDEAYLHTWTRDLVRTQLNADPSADGTGYTYPIINYDNAIVWPSWIDFNPLRPNRFRDDYIVLPAIAAKQIFDKIFEETGYSYEMSADMEYYLSKLYIPFNDDLSNWTVDSYKYAKYYLGNPTDLSYTTTTVGLTPYGITNWFFSQVIPRYSVIGWTFADTHLPSPNQVSGGYDKIINRPVGDKSVGYTIEIPHAGNYIIDVSMYLYNTSSNAKSTEWSLTTWNGKDGNVAKPIGSLDLNGNTGGYINSSVEVAVSEKSTLCIHRSTESDSQINLIFGPWTYIEINELNSFIGANNEFELNTMLPKNYKKADFLNDIFKMFNAFITIDDIDEKKLYIKTYDDFYSTGQTYDWSSKIDNNSIKFTPIKNTFAKNTYFSFTDDADIYSTDYLSKYPKGIYSEQVINDSDFASADNEIKLSCSQGIVTIVTDSIGYTIPAAPATGARVLTISDDKQFKTSWKPKLLFSDTVDISAFLYGSDASASADPYIRKWTTLGPRLSYDLTDSSNCFIGFNSENTYTSILYTETNETLFNKYYKKDIESNLSDDSYLLEAKFFLTSEDIARVSFDDIIKINHSKLGNAFYRLNAVKDYVPGGGLTTVELLKINIIDSEYDSSVATNIVYRSITAEGGTPGAGSGSSSSGGGGTTGGGTLQEVTDAGNITTNEIIFQNPGDSGSQVALQVNTDSELTIDGTSIEDKFLHQVATADRFIISNTNGDSSTYEWAKYDKINDKIVLNKTIEINGTLNSVTGDLIIQPNSGALNLYSDTGNEINIDAQNSFLEINADAGIRIIDDVSLGGDIYADSIKGHYPFMSGFTGTGYQLIKDPNNKYRLELDNLMVRGSLTAYEMILHKIRALNGSLWVSSAVEAVWPGEASTYIPAGLYYGYDSFGKYGPYFYTEPNNNTLMRYDYIRSQQFLGNNIHQVDWVVRDSSGDMIFVNNLSTTSVVDASWMAPTSNTYELINIDASSLTLSGASGYSLLMTEQGQKIKTGYFTVRGAGRLQASINWLTQTSPYKHIRSRIEYGDGSILTEWRDSSTSYQAAGPYYLGTLGSYEITDTTFTGDSSCYIVIENMEPDVSIDIFSLKWDNLLDYTIPYRDVTGFTFVRRGNDEYENRQGAIYLTADDENAPFIEVLDDMTSHDIAASNRKVRLGKLDGLTWRDSSIGGYGLWTDSAYLSGAINAESGLIGNFEIDNGKIIGTGTNSDRIILDPDLPSMILTDASQSIVAEVTNQPILSIDDIQSTTEILYAGSEADTYTDVNQQYNQGTYYSGTRYWRPTIYIKNHQTTGNTDLDASTSERDNTYDIRVEDGGTYSVNMSVNVNVTTLLPESSAGGYHEPPSYFDVPEYTVEVEKHFYSLGGYYTINASTYFFAGDDTSLGNTHKTNFGSLTSSLSNWQVVTNKSITATDTSVYIKLVPEIKNALYALDYVEYWYSVENEYGEWVWQEVSSTTMDRDVSTLFNIEVEQLVLNGRLQKTQIGQDGILTYWNSDKYFTVNNREDPLIQSAGGWTHTMTSAQNIRLNHNGETASANTPFALACSEQGWMMALQNKRNANDGWGMLLDAGNGSSTASNLIMFRDYNGTEQGSITHESEGAIYLNKIGQTYPNSKTVTTTPVTLNNYDRVVRWSRTAGNGSVYLPTSPSFGQQHTIINASVREGTNRSVLVYPSTTFSYVDPSIYNNGSFDTYVSYTGGHTGTFMFDGKSWHLINFR